MKTIRLPFAGEFRRKLRRIGPVVDLYLLLRSPRIEASIWADYARTRRETRFLRKARTDAAADAPVVLVGALTDWLYELKVLLMLATALRLEGWRPVFLVSRTTRRAIRYCRAFGIKDFAFYDDLETTASEEVEIRALAPTMLRDPLSFQTVKELSFGESWIGPQILATVSRMLLAGAPDPQDKATADHIRNLLPDVLRGVFRGRRVMQSIQPKMLLVNEANYSFYGVLVDVAIGNGADAIQATQPWRDDALMCKRLTKRTRRSHPSSVEPETMEWIKARPWTEADERQLADHFRMRYGGEWYLQGRNQPHVENEAPAAVRHQLGVRTEDKLAVIFSHVLWDANLFYGADLFDDYGHWLVETVRAACGNDSVMWLVKLHPANIWKREAQGVTGRYSEVDLLEEHVGMLPTHVKLLYPETRISSLSLYEAADLGVTVRGTPGMEMPCFGKPVLTAGTGRYSGLGFTVDSKTASEYLDRLRHVQGVKPLTPEQTLLAKRHAKAVFISRQWQMKSFYSTFKEGPPTGTNHNLRVRARSLAELKELGDLVAWATWARSSKLDFLDPSTQA
ncbi:MAG: hypothetical protein M3198_06000 [Actinomycetota bacterium]|nr:hypothetical protein [Actinomycetota bacterium]